MKARTLALAGLAGLASLAGLVVAGCRGGSTAAPPAMTSASSPSPEPVSASSGIPVMRVVLDDPRLARARELDQAKDPSGAARAVRDARPTDLVPAERCAWDFLEGRLWLQGGASSDALAAFARADSADCPLGAWARLRAAQAAARAGRADDAIQRARGVPDEITAARDEVRLVIAESLAAKGERAAALPLWRAWLAANPHGSRWVDTSVRIASALLDGVDGPSEGHAREAYELATKVVIEAPKLAEASGAVAARSRAVAVGQARDSSITEALTEDARARQAQGWLDAAEPTKAFDAATALLAAVRTGPAACRAAIVRANAVAKIRGNRTDAWPDAIAACDKDEQLAAALYFGAKAHASRDPKQAIEWFGRIEQLFPSHRLADDARYRAALLVAQSSEEGHEQRADRMLRTLPDAYPDGDMRTEALFHVALETMKRGDWAAAKPLLGRILELAPNDRHWATAGRAEYFLARGAASAGDLATAQAGYAAIVAKYPLSFYMLLAHARLAADDPGLAKRTVTEAVRREVGGPFPSRPHAVLQSQGFARSVRLLEVGDVDAARRELVAAGAVADGADPEILWSVGAIYNQAGFPELGHAFSRGKVTDILEHYPEGKWRIPWTVAYPRAFEALVLKACASNGLPPNVAWAVMREESSFVADARSHSNALGLMQLMGPTARWVATGTGWSTDEASLKRPEVSVDLGVRLLAKLRATHGHPALAIGAYNAGSGAIERWLASRPSEDLDLFVELVPYDETRNYIKRVLSSQAAYAYLYDPSALDEAFRLPLRLAR